MQSPLKRRVKFTAQQTTGGRIHYLSEEDVRVLLARLPAAVWRRLNSVHFNDQSRGNRILGYVTRGRDAISICALPTSMSLRRALNKGQTPEEFGAVRNRKWSAIAIRRFLIYNVFLHELGLLQLVDPQRPSKRLRFAREKLAQEFAERWCKTLWSQPFDHPDPVHNPPTEVELQTIGRPVAIGAKG